MFIKVQPADDDDDEDDDDDDDDDDDKDDDKDDDDDDNNDDNDDDNDDGYEGDDDDDNDNDYSNEDELVTTLLEIIYLFLVIHSFDTFTYDKVKHHCFGTFNHISCNIMHYGSKN